MDIKKATTAGALAISLASSAALGVDNGNKGREITEMRQSMGWEKDKVDAVEQLQTVVRRQRQILDQWDSCELCKKQCSDHSS